MTFPKELEEVDGGTIGGTIGGQAGGQVGGQVGGPMDDLTERQKEVLTVIKADQKIAIRKLAKLLDINVSAAQEHIDVLKQKKIIERIGGTRGYWKILIG